MNDADAQAFEELLALMEADLEVAPGLMRPTPFWREASGQLKKDLAGEGISRFRRLGGPLRFFVPTYGPPGSGMSRAQLDELLAKSRFAGKARLSLEQALGGAAAATADYRVFLAGDRRGIAPDLTLVSESSVGEPLEQFEFEGRFFSRSFLNYLHGLVFLKQILGEAEIHRVLEIGGGFGTLGEILGQCGGFSYVDVDIPPTAAVATYYLRKATSGAVHDYRETRGRDRLSPPPDGESMVLCPWQLNRLEGEIDLLWNFISFQEMEPPVVKSYLDQTMRLGARFVLLRNLREGKQRRRPGSVVGVDEPILGTDYDRFLPGYRLIGTNVFPFGHRTVDGFHSELRLYARE